MVLPRPDDEPSPARDVETQRLELERDRAQLELQREELELLRRKMTLEERRADAEIQKGRLDHAHHREMDRRQQQHEHRIAYLNTSAPILVVFMGVFLAAIGNPLGSWVIGVGVSWALGKPVLGRLQGGDE